MSIPGSANPLLLASAAEAGAYSISRSVRLNSADSAYFSRTPASSGNRKTWTWAGWVKRSALGGTRAMFGVAAGSVEAFDFNSSDNLRFYTIGGSGALLASTAVFRDTSAWMHLVLSVDTTQATASNRTKIYVNGAQITQFGSSTYPAQNYDTFINNNNIHYIGDRGAGLQPFDGYLADIHFIDGQALDPTSFGEFDDNGIWQPIAYSGTYGTNGFHLPFADNSTAAALGTDTSGNGNNWTPTNLSVSTAYFSVSPVPSEPQDAFNGITSNYAYGGSTTVFTLNPSVAVVGGRIDMMGRIGPNYTYKAITNAGTFTLSEIGAWPGVGGTYGQQYSVTNGSITSLLGVQVETAAGNWTLAGVQVTGNPSVVGNQLLVIPFAAPSTDSFVDVPTNGTETDTGVGGEVRGNYCTFNPLKVLGSTATFSNGNLDISTTSTGFPAGVGTIGVATGKWYFEVTPTGGSGRPQIGVCKDSDSPNSNGIGGSAGAYIYESDAFKANNHTFTSYGATFTTNDVIGVGLDLDAGTITFYKNGVSQGQAYSGLSGTFFPVVSEPDNAASITASANFGQRPFAYTAPSGFKALCTANLPSPVITKPSTVMDVKLYTGNGSTQTISGLEFSPDFVWIKCRNLGHYHELQDAVRGFGSGKNLESNTTTAEGANNDGYVDSVTSNGFVVTAGSGTGVNGNSYVAWAWDAGSSTVTNTQGSISSQVRANASAGFSIVTYTGTGSNGTVGHGLGIAPSFYVVKARSVSGESWIVYHSGAGMKFGVLNATNAFDSNTSTIWNNTAASSTVFSLGNNTAVNGNGTTYVSYLFAPVAGYSSFGSYTGNGSADGPFIYTGFRPKWVMIKGSSFVSNWNILDAARDPYNLQSNRLRPNLSNAEESSPSGTFAICWDALSNGFKLRGGSGTNDVNQTSETLIYAAFAESPFQYARAR